MHLAASATYLCLVLAVGAIVLFTRVLLPGALPPLGAAHAAACLVHPCVLAGLPRHTPDDKVAGAFTHTIKAALSLDPAMVGPDRVQQSRISGLAGALKQQVKEVDRSIVRMQQSCCGVNSMQLLQGALGLPAAHRTPVGFLESTCRWH